MAPIMTSAAAPHRRLRAGFTLVEVILAVAIIGVLAGTLVISTTGWYRTEAVEQAAGRVESILRVARAQACSQSRRFRLAFEQSETTTTPMILWEPRPLAEPGNFVPHYGAWANDLPSDLLTFIQCRRTGDSARKLLTYSDVEEPVSPEGEPLQSVTFLPDGSCDSAVIEFVAADGPDGRVGRIEINGLTASIDMRIMTATEYAEQQAIDQEAQEPPL